MDSLSSLLKQKSFEEIAVQEITDHATLNRNTFYLHYPDKMALLRAMTDVEFRELIAKRGITFTDCTGALRAVALGVCDYLTGITNCSVKGAAIPLEGSIIPAIEGMFLEGASRHHLVPGIEPSLMATTAAWAVFGAARRWHENPKRVSAEKMALKIEKMVKPIFLSSFK